MKQGTGGISIGWRITGTGEHCCINHTVRSRGLDQEKTCSMLRKSFPRRTRKVDANVFPDSGYYYPGRLDNSETARSGNNPLVNGGGRGNANANAFSSKGQPNAEEKGGEQNNGGEPDVWGFDLLRRPDADAACYVSPFSAGRSPMPDLASAGHCSHNSANLNTDTRSLLFLLYVFSAQKVGGECQAEATERGAQEGCPPFQVPAAKKGRTLAARGSLAFHCLGSHAIPDHAWGQGSGGFGGHV